MEAGNSVIECALMGIQQTHKPNKKGEGEGSLSRRARVVSRLYHGPSFQLSLPLLAALLGFGLLGYLVFRTGPGGRVEAAPDGRLGSGIDHHSGRFLSVHQHVRVETGVYLRYYSAFMVPKLRHAVDL